MRKGVVMLILVMAAFLFWGALILLPQLLRMM